MPRPDVDYSNLNYQPSPQDFFLLSRLDGSLTVGQLCQISGLSAQDTLDALERLWGAGMIELPGRARPEPRAAQVGFGAEPASLAAAHTEPIRQTPGAVTAAEMTEEMTQEMTQEMTIEQAPPQPDDPMANPPVYWADWPLSVAQFSFDPHAMAEQVELTEAQRRELLYVSGMLKHLDHYQMLGVSRGSKRKQIRGAYFKLSKRYHPDLFYGRELGSYRERLDEIFKGLNVASGVLSSKQKRAKYDESLERLRARQASGIEFTSDVVPSASPAPSMSSFSRTAGPSRHKVEQAVSQLIKTGERFEAEGNFAHAAVQYAKAFALNRDVRLGLRGANLFMRGGQEHLQRAISLAGDVLAHDPQNIKALIALGDAYEEKGEQGQAKAQYEKARELDPSNKVVHRRLRYLDSASS